MLNQKQNQNKKTLEQWLESVSYDYLNSSRYMPTMFALTFVNFIKLVNGTEGESNKTPPMHLKMLDTIANRKKDYLVNLCFRGAAKALAIDTPILTTDGWTDIEHLKVGQSIYGIDGKPATVMVKSEVFNKPMYRLHLADGRELDVSEDHINVIIHRKGRKDRHGTENVYEEISTKDLLKYKLFTTRSKTKKNPKGKETMVWIPLPKAMEFEKKNLPIDPYTLGLILGDGHIEKDNGMVNLTAHKDDMEFYKKNIPHLLGSEWVDKRNPNVHTISIRKLGKIMKTYGLNVHGDYKFIPSDYLYSSIEDRIELLKGLMDTDGTLDYAKGSGAEFSSNSELLARGVQFLIYSLGGSAKVTSSISASGKTHYKVFINSPINIFKLPRKADKYSTKSFKDKIPLESITKINTVPSQCIAVDNESHTFLAGDLVPTHNTSLFGEYMVLYIAMMGELPGLKDISGMIYVADSMENGAKSLRKNIEFRYEHSDFLKQVIPKAKFTDTELNFENMNGHRLGVKLFGATTGLRGTKIDGKRPVLAVLDDLLSDEASKSKVVMNLIKDTVYKGINHALDPTKRLVIFNGTPFNKEDVLLEAVESGAWEVNVYPVCERFPCSREDFKGAWEDRFSYDYIKDQYELAKGSGHLNAFYQELMLQITSEDERLIQNSEIRWYQRSILLNQKNAYNFYITTDFATSSKNSADFSVISVWAYNNNGDWFWVDGICRKQTMDRSIDDLFSLVQEYSPQQVGVEITGQQGAFIKWLQQEMMYRNIWFNFASSDKNNNTPGIRPTVDKLTRLNLVVPWFKAGKVYFPSEMEDTSIMTEFMSELRLATINGIKGHDDCLDTISQLAYLKAWKPSVVMPIENKNSMWDDDMIPEEKSGLNSYLV